MICRKFSYVNTRKIISVYLLIIFKFIPFIIKIISELRRKFSLEAVLEKFRYNNRPAMKNLCLYTCGIVQVKEIIV
ncbi:hypothetical protein A9970_04440 [Sphingobacterium sp. UME9]|nr:hypothetical protein [Sphingobacterium sp. UME9]